MNDAAKNLAGWRKELHTIIFGADTPAGKWFDILLIICILASVLAVMLDSVHSMNIRYGAFFNAAEWFFTIIFSVEYILRLICVAHPRRYATSFFGLVDFIAIMPTYISLIIPGSEYFLVVRILRILRIFRVFKLVQYMGEALLLTKALRASSRKITVFLFTVLTLVIILGSLMYLIEGAQNGFTSIPRSIYWAIVTLTTVGYGDISPQTSIGQMLAAGIMILGYSIIAVPTGIVTVELSQASNRKRTGSCRNCTTEKHDSDAVFCKYCGAKL
jgi:voltage-gated potassium channel